MNIKKDDMRNWLFWGTGLSLPFVTFDLFSAYFYPLVAQGDWYNEVTLGLFLLDFIILFLTMYMIVKTPLSKVFVSVSAMSLSTLLLGMMMELLFAHILIPLRIGEYGIILDFLFFSVCILISALLQACIALMYFPYLNRNILFSWLLCVNTLSTGIGFLIVKCLVIYIQSV